MKTLFFNTNKSEIVEALKSNSVTNINFDKIEDIHSNSESFNIAMILDDNDNLLDYRVFDPFHRAFSGYTTPRGWSNWEMDYMSNIDLFIEGYSPSEDDLNTVDEIDNY